jgi:phosphoglycolate phosphatase-like HAD superfamily hydrolase
MMNCLIIFDIDGTLIHYISAEDQAYLNALKEISQIDRVNTQWDEYNYSTESGILREIFISYLGRYPTPEEEHAIKVNYISSLEKALKASPNSCIPGAQQVFSHISKLNWDIAIATGAWSESAKVKLAGSQMPELGVPMAHGDDHYERKDIILTAIQRAKNFYKKEEYHNIIYVGDRPWDREAASMLNIGFIGVGQYLGSLKPKDFFHVEHYDTPLFLDYLKV